MILVQIRRLRHGPLKFMNSVWVILGSMYRRFVAGSNMLCEQRIGRYGPFHLDAKFTFSDFANWGGAHNDGFGDCVEACRGKHCVIDVGAHIGLVSLPVASVLAPGGVLVSFEPARANRDLLARHLRINGFESVRVEGSLVGGEDLAEVDFFEMEDASGMNSVVPGAMGTEYHAVRKVQVSLDAYCERHNLSPEVVKIDVEGAELGVLRGARAMLSRCRPLVFLSVHPRQIALLGESTEALSALIDSLNYDCRQADGTPVQSFALREYLLVPREKPSCP